jgi:hypothetical protein
MNTGTVHETLFSVILFGPTPCPSPIAAPALPLPLSFISLSMYMYNMQGKLTVARGGGVNKTTA